MWRKYTAAANWVRPLVSISQHYPALTGSSCPRFQTGGLSQWSSQEFEPRALCRQQLQHSHQLCAKDVLNLHGEACMGRREPIHQWDNGSQNEHLQIYLHWCNLNHEMYSRTAKRILTSPWYLKWRPSTPQAKQHHYGSGRRRVSSHTTWFKCALIHLLNVCIYLFIYGFFPSCYATIITQIVTCKLN